MLSSPGVGGNDFKFVGMGTYHTFVTSLMDEKVYETLKNTAINLQSQLAVARLQLEAYLKDKSTP